MKFAHSKEKSPSFLEKEKGSIENKKIAAAGLQAFFNITELWNLSAYEQRMLIGNPPSSTFSKWKSNKMTSQLDSETLERISYIIGIHKALMTLLPSDEASYNWIKKPNDAPLFKGNMALSRLLEGRVSDLFEVRKYLDGECT